MNKVKIKHFIFISIVVLMIAYADKVFTKSNQIFLLDITGPIGPATRDYMIDGIEQAEKSDAELVILRLDTPGGLSDSMRDMIKKILNSQVAIVTWVGPSGSRAASAGTYIMYASHINAMAPSTHLGAATPVAITGGKNPFKHTKKDKESQNDTEDGTQLPSKEIPQSIDKAIEDAVAYIQSLAEHRGRNVEWAESAVRSAASLSSDQALEKNIIDMIAHDIESLLNQIDGLTVSLPNQTKQLSVKGGIVTTIEPTWQNKFLATITNPTFAYILLLIGIYGLIIEGYNPGALVPGVIGGVSLLLALYAFQILPVNFAGLALIILGFVLIITEFFVPAFGILGIGGMVALVFGSIIMMDTEVPGFGIPIGLIIGVAISAGLIFVGLMYMVARAFRKPKVLDSEQLLGKIAEVISSNNEKGLRVHINGEDWRATSAHKFQVGDHVLIESIDKLTLAIKPLENEND